MEGTQKRTRDEAQGDAEDGSSLGKKMRESSEAAPETTSLVLDVKGGGEEVLLPCLSSSSAAQLLQEEDSSPKDGAESKAILRETLRSLEEELGVSGDDSAGHAPAVADGEELSGSMLENWGQEIWNVDVFPAEKNDTGETGEGDILFGGSSVGETSLSSGASESTSSRNSPAEEGAELTAAAARPVDIGFLREASDDELGIPPSPTSDEREQSTSEATPAAREQSSSDQNSVDALQDAVSWALEEGGGDSADFSDSGIDDWMIGNLDFIMDSPVVAYGAGSPLVETGVLL